MQLHTLQPKTQRATNKRIGRGGKRGKTSGKGGKGQTARAGGRPRPELRDFIKKLPKLRGFGKNRARTVNAERVRPVVVNISVLDAHFASGEAVSPKTLAEKKLVSLRSGKLPLVKILATGDLTKKLTVSGCELSETAKEKIVKAGGTVA